MQSACSERRASGSGNLEALPHQACVSLRLRRRCRRCRRRRCLLLLLRRRRRRRRHRPRDWPPSRLPPLPNREYPVEARRSTARSSRTPGRGHRCRVWNSSARMHTYTRAPVIACAAPVMRQSEAIRANQSQSEPIRAIQTIMAWTIINRNCGFRRHQWQSPI